MNPLEFAVFGIECALLQPTQFQRETRAQLLQSGFLTALKHVSMVPKEDKIALIVESDDSTAAEFWLLVKQRTQHTGHTVTQTSVKAVDDDFRAMLGGCTMAREIAAETNTGELVISSGTAGKVNVSETV